MAKPVIGIDLGTTNSCMATLEHGQPKVLENAEGGRTTPSVVAYLNDGEKLVGPAARRQAVTNPGRTISSIKRFMGRKLSEVADEQETVPYQLVAGGNDAVRVLVESNELAPEQLSALVLAKLKADAEGYLGQSVEDAVITVPAYFNDAQRQATQDAASIAGLNVLRIINEPTAAALAYGFAQEEGAEDKTVLVFDLGGGTFDVSVLDIGDGVYDVQATKGDNHLGGDDFDKALVDWMVSEFQREHSIDLAKDPTALQRLQDAAEKAKMELSSAQRTHISLPFITAIDGQPAHLDVHMTRAEFEQLCEPLLDRLVGPAEQAMSDADLSPADLDAVLLVGGMTRMPAIQEAVKRITGLDPLRGVNPDEAVAAGAAIQAGVLAGDVEDVLLVDVTPVALGIETKGGVFTKLVQANTTVPARVTETFTTAEDNQPSVEVHVLQGEREMAKDNRSLGRVVLLGIPPAVAGMPQVEVTFDINTDGILQVTAQDLGTGAQTETTIKDSTGLSSEEVERMRAEAAEYAEHDRTERENAEARNQAEALRDQARRLLRDHAEEMPTEMRESIEKALGGLDNALRDNADRPALASAVGEVTEVVQRFSERLYSDPPEVPQANEADEADVVDDEPELVENPDEADLDRDDDHPEEPDRLSG